MFIDEFQAKIWRDKYQYKDETFDGFCNRISSNIFPEDESKKNYLHSLLSDFKVLFGGRINSNIGVEEQGLTLFNCFIESISQGPDSLIGIVDMLSKYVLTLKTEGGVGFCADFFRPSRTIIRKIGVASPGPIKFLEGFDKFSEVITSGSVDKDNCFQGKPSKNSIRKGATMITMSCSHPDIEEFITAKAIPNKLTKMNMSVLVTDDFIKAVKDDLDWDLWYPDINYEKYDSEWDGNLKRWKEKGYPIVIYKTVKASYLWDVIMKNSHRRNEPGILFIDNARKMNNLHYLNGEMLSSNPCVVEGTLVATSNGLTPVENLKVGDSIQTTLGFGDIKEIKVYEEEDIYRVNFSDGFYQDVTKGHIFHTMLKGTESRKKWHNDRRLSDIDNSYFVRKERYKSFPNIDNTLDRNDGLLIGLYLGDGSYSNYNNFNIAANIEEDNSYIEELFAAKGGSFRIDKSEGNAIRYYSTFNNEYIKSLFHRLQIGPNGKIINIEKLLNTNKDFIVGLIDGLISSDGDVNLNGNYPQVRFTNTSMDLHNLLKHLMLFVGADYKLYNSKKVGEKSVIYGREVYRTKNCPTGIIDNDSILNLFNALSFLSHKDKNDKLLTVVKNNQLNGVKWKTLIKNIEHIGKGKVYDIYEPNADDWNHEGYVSRGCGEVIATTGIEYLNGEPVEMGDVCNLGSINLTKFYDVETRAFCVKELKAAVDIMVRALDNVIDISDYPLLIYENAAKYKRKVGVGFMGLGSLMMMMNVRYGSDECIDILHAILKEFINQAYQTSALIAKEKGPFTLYSDRLLDAGFVGNSNVLTKDTLDLIKKYGLRNSALSAIAPNGSTSIVVGNVSGGVEPVFAKEFFRWNRVEGKKVDFNYPKVHLGEWYETDYFKEDTIADEKVLVSLDGDYRIDKNTGLCERVVIMDYGYKIAKDRGFKNVATATELSVEEHLKVLSTVAHYIDQSVSKCIEMNHRIYTNRGLKKIGDLSTCRNPDTFEKMDDAISVRTISGVKNISSFYYNGFVNGKKIITDNGMELSGSSTHRIKVLDKDFNLIWKSLSDIEIGDITPIQLKQDISSELTINKILDRRFEKPKGCMSINIPTQLSRNLLWWLGCVYADGNVNSKGVHLTQVGGTTLDRFIEISRELFNYNVVLVKDNRRDNLFTASINSKVLSEWMNYIEFNKEKISELVFCSTPLMKKSFVEGMTLDGYISNTTVCIKTDKSIDIIKDLQLICAAIGIPTYYRTSYNKTYKRDYYILCVSPGNLKSMSNFVFPEQHKQEAFEALYNARAYNSRNVYDSAYLRFPISESMVTKVGSIEKRVTTSGPLYNVMHRIFADAKAHMSLTLEQLFVVFNFDGEIPAPFTEKYLFTKISEVRDVRIETADIEVEEEHNYIVDGFLSHNTISLPSDISFEDFKSLYTNIHSYGIKGCTTYREGSSVAVLETQRKEQKKTIEKQQEEFLDSFKGQENGDVIFHNIQLPDEYPEKGYILRSDGGRKYYLSVAFKDKACTRPFAIFVNTNNKEDNVLTFNALEKLEEIAIFKGINNNFIEETKKKYASQRNPVKICRMLGLLLRHNIDVATIVKGLSELDAIVGTFVFHITKFLGRFMEEHEVTGMVCPECGGKSMRFYEGCISCTCGYSRCG